MKKVFLSLILFFFIYVCACHRGGWLLLNNDSNKTYLIKRDSLNIELMINTMQYSTFDVGIKISTINEMVLNLDSIKMIFLDSGIPYTVDNKRTGVLVNQSVYKNRIIKIKNITNISIAFTVNPEDVTLDDKVIIYLDKCFEPKLENIEPIEFLIPPI